MLENGACGWAANCQLKLHSCDREELGYGGQLGAALSGILYPARSVSGILAFHALGPLCPTLVLPGLQTDLPVWSWFWTPPARTFHVLTFGLFISAFLPGPACSFLIAFPDHTTLNLLDIQ